MKKRNTWRLIAKSLGEKAGKDDKEADKIALIRLFITFQILITNFFIIFGVVRLHIIPAEPQPVKCIIINN
jgi:hypothetical protein